MRKKIAGIQQGLHAALKLDTTGVGAQVLSCLQNDTARHMVANNGCAAGACGHHHAPGKAEEEDEDDGDDEDEDGEEDEEDEDEETNSEGGGDLVFPAAYAPALAELLGARGAGGVPVRAIRLPSKEEKLGLAYTLHAEGVLCTLPKKGSPS